MSNLKVEHLEMIQELIRKELFEVWTSSSLMERQLKKDLQEVQAAVRKELQERKALKRLDFEDIRDIFDILNLAKKISRKHALADEYAIYQALDILGFEIGEQEIESLTKYNDKELFEKVQENKTYTLNAEGELIKTTRERIERLDVTRVWEVIGVAYPEKKGLFNNNTRKEYIRLVTCLTPEKAEERRLAAEQKLVPSRFHEIFITPKDIEDGEIGGSWW